MRRSLRSVFSPRDSLRRVRNRLRNSGHRFSRSVKRHAPSPPTLDLHKQREKLHGPNSPRETFRRVRQHFHNHPTPVETVTIGTQAGMPARTMVDNSLNNEGYINDTPKVEPVILRCK